MPWSQRFPTLQNLLKNHPELPTGNIIQNNLFVNCQKLIRKKAKAEQLSQVTFSNNLESKNADFLNAVKKKITLPDTGNAIINEIPIQKIGLQHKH